jgi:hypothetical protein
MTALKLAIHAGSLPAARTTVPLCQIGPQWHPPPGRAPCDPQVCTHTYHRPPSQSDRVDRCRPTPSRPTLRSNLHSARCTLRALPTAISCLGAFRTPAAQARGWHRGCRRPKTCTPADSRSAANIGTGANHRSLTTITVIGFADPGRRIKHAMVGVHLGTRLVHQRWLRSVFVHFAW